MDPPQKQTVPRTYKSPNQYVQQLQKPPKKNTTPMDTQKILKKNLSRVLQTGRRNYWGKAKSSNKKENNSLHENE
jgi:hypothetical protein